MTNSPRSGSGSRHAGYQTPPGSRAAVLRDRRAVRTNRTRRGLQHSPQRRRTRLLCRLLGGVYGIAGAFTVLDDLAAFPALHAGRHLCI
ncbi:hypothetical protein ACRAWF_00545 [Streptomyces sp. L7]